MKSAINFFKQPAITVLPPQFYVSPPFKNSHPYSFLITRKKSLTIEHLEFLYLPTVWCLLIIIFKQKQDKGISFFISQLQNSFTRFYNIKFQRTGPVFLEQFKSKPITTEEQLEHVSRYIHRNPYSGRLISQINKIRDYPNCSFLEYLQLAKNNLCDPSLVLSLFNNSIKNYEAFVLNNAEHQKTLEYFKYSNKW